VTADDERGAVDEGGNSGAAVRVELLGPLRLVVAGGEVAVPGERRRAVLALLAAAGGRSVSTDALLDAAWPGEAPESGRRAIHNHISRLRGHLGPAADRLVREGNGYRLTLGPGELDVAEARRLAAEAGSAAPGDAVAHLGRAVGLWRGPALAEFADVDDLAAEAVGLAELRRDLTDAWLEARLAVRAVLERFPDLRRVPTRPKWMPNLVIRGLEELHLEFSPRAARSSN
jgi:DNA-binding SARP family transcriptional activator